MNVSVREYEHRTVVEAEALRVRAPDCRPHPDDAGYAAMDPRQFA
ncbi:hypothetical protein [Nocardia thraciensis]